MEPSTRMLLNSKYWKTQAVCALESNLDSRQHMMCPVMSGLNSHFQVVLATLDQNNITHRNCTLSITLQ